MTLHCASRVQRSLFGHTTTAMDFNCLQGTAPVPALQVSTVHGMPSLQSFGVFLHVPARKTTCGRALCASEALLPARMHGKLSYETQSDSLPRPTTAFIHCTYAHSSAPVAASQLSSVHLLPSLQFFGVFMHSPANKPVHGLTPCASEAVLC